MSAPTVYYKGDTAEIRGEFRNDAGVLYTPTSVAFRYKKPDDTILPVVPTTTTVGIYLATWVVDQEGHWIYEWSSLGGASTLPGEFDVLVNPINEPTFGRVMDAAQTILGLTWARLENASWYGAAKLQIRVLAAKNRWLPAALVGADESTYPALLVDYLGKRTALEIIPAGIEYWMDQAISITATGTNETISKYGSRVKALQDLAADLERDCAELMGNPALVDYFTASGVGPDVSDGSDEDMGMVTTSAYDWPPAFDSDSDVPLLFPLGE